jgi:hypothetical protein
MNALNSFLGSVWGYTKTVVGCIWGTIKGLASDLLNFFKQAPLYMGFAGAVGGIVLLALIFKGFLAPALLLYWLLKGITWKVLVSAFGIFLGIEVVSKLFNNILIKLQREEAAEVVEEVQA